MASSWIRNVLYKQAFQIDYYEIMIKLLLSSKLLLWKQNFKVFIIWLYRYIYLKARFCTNMPETQLKFQHRILMAALFIERFINLHKKNL